MSEMDRFEDELNKIEPETIRDEEFKKKLYKTLMERYEKRRRFILSPLFKVSITIGIIIILSIPLYFILSPLGERTTQRKGETMIMEKTSLLLENLTKDDELLYSHRESGKEILRFKSGLMIVKGGERIERVSYGERILSLPEKGLYVERAKGDVKKIQSIIERDKKIGFIMKEGKIEDVRIIDKDIFYIIISSYRRRWGIVVDAKKAKVIAFFSPPE